MKVRKILVSVFTVMMLLTSSLLSAAAEDSEAIQNNSIITGSDFEKMRWESGFHSADVSCPWIIPTVI